jgi:hypothetical protein
MTKLFGAIVLGIGLALVPVTIRSNDGGKAPTLALSDACAQAGKCCPAPGEFCLLDGKLTANYQLCSKPGT